VATINPSPLGGGLDRPQRHNGGDEGWNKEQNALGIHGTLRAKTVRQAQQYKQAEYHERNA
jgi:hypothetical protein